MILQGLLFAAAGVFVLTLFLAYGSNRLAWDFRVSYLPAAEAVIRGDSPYPPAGIDAAALHTGYIYPPLLAFALAPFTIVSPDVAAVLAVVGALGAILGALWIVGVRDPLCFAALLLWAPAWNALEMAQVSAPLTLGLALAWRYRTTTWPLAAVLGLAIATKLFLWPLLVWAATTRRLRRAALAVGVGAAVTLVSWAAIGFAGLTGYPNLLRVFSEYQDEGSYSIVGVASLFGAGDSVGRLVSFVAGALLLLGCIRAGRRAEDLRAFTFAIAAALALSPIVWQHYLVLLAVPLAISRPRFSILWLLPIILWVSPRAGNGDGVETLLPAAVACVLLVGIIARSGWRAAPPSPVPA